MEDQETPDSPPKLTPGSEARIWVHYRVPFVCSGAKDDFSDRSREAEGETVKRRGKGEKEVVGRGGWWGPEGPRSFGERVVGSVGIATCWRPYRALSSPDPNWVNPSNDGTLFSPRDRGHRGQLRGARATKHVETAPRRAAVIPFPRRGPKVIPLRFTSILDDSTGSILSNR